MKMFALRPVASLGLVAAVLLGACSSKTHSPDGPEDAARSPNATILPAPLASTAPAEFHDAAVPSGPVGMSMDPKGRPVADAGLVEPTALVPGQSLALDRLALREVPGATLEGEWIWSKVPSAPSGPEVASQGIDAARKATRHKWQVDLAELGRMRVMFDAPSFALTRYTELRSRIDHYGHVLLWPNADAYRVVPPGALRALIDERRMDVSPLSAGKITRLPKEGSRFSFPTKTVQIATSLGKLQLEQANAPAVGSGGVLLCRLLVELVGAEPSSAACEPGKVPVGAEYTWANGSSVRFNVDSLLLRSDYPSGLFMAPPGGATFTDSGLPPTATGIFLNRDQVAAFRSRPTDARGPRKDPAANGAPAEGFIGVNNSDALRFLLLDGVPVAWVPAHGQQYLIGTVRGRYVVQWRSFLGSLITEPQTLEFPARFVLGEEPDAGPEASPH